MVKVFNDKIEIFNPGGLPEGITIKKLLKGEYISIARDKKVAEVFKAAGLIEKYGSGIKRILNAFKEYGLPPPEFKEMSGGFMVTVYKKITQVTGQVTLRILSFCQQPQKASAIQSLLNLKHRETFFNNYLKPLLSKGLLSLTIPEKPKSRLQRYRTTDKGKELLNAQTD